MHRLLTNAPLVMAVVSALCVHCLPLVSSESEQGTQRVARGRYKMGYMFGKRAGLEAHSPALLLSSIMGKAVSVEELARSMKRDAVLAQRVARHLDTNGDGYVSVRELL